MASEKAPIDIRVLEDLKEINPLTHAGCYELVQKAVGLYGKMEAPNNLTVADLDMIISFTQIGWTFKGLKTNIDESSLPDESKKTLNELLSSVEEKYNRGEYRNIENSKGVGLVSRVGGTIAKHYTPTSDEISRFLLTLVNILSKDSSEEVCNAAMGLPQIKDVKIGTISPILHCLKPDVFPIWNGKSGNFFPRLPITPRLPKTFNNGNYINEYVEASKRLNEFRENNGIKFKNWRAVDMLAYSDSSGDSKTANNDSKNAGESSGLETEFRKWLNLKIDMSAVGKHYIPAFHNESFHKLLQADPFTISTEGRFREMVEKMKKDYSSEFENLNKNGSTGKNDLGACITKYAEFLSIFRPERNLIYFGAPGTGKSHKLTGGVEKQFSANYYKRVTFYPTYSYAQFIGCYKPVMNRVKDEKGIETDKKEIAYEFVPGPFLRVLVEALKDSNHNHCLVIEEINRANAAAVFGDMFQLLDRKDNGESEYDIAVSKDVKEFLKDNGIEKDRLRIPANMYIWATMNSADQGVFPMDTAFKRRWEFEYIPIDAGEDAAPDGKKKPNEWTIKGVKDAKGTEYKWNEVRHFLNGLLSLHGVNEDKLMGAHFVQAPDGVVSAKAFESKVLMYLWEDAGRMCRKELFGNILTYSKLVEEWRGSGIGVFQNDTKKDSLETLKDGKKLKEWYDNTMKKEGGTTPPSDGTFG